MTLLAKTAAACAVSVLCAAGAEAATVVTDPFFYDNNALTFVAPDDSYSEEYTLSALKSFDLVFSGSGLIEDLDKVNYVVTEDDSGDILASGVLTGTESGSTLATIDSTAITFWADEDFTISLFANDLDYDFSFTYSLVSPAAEVPLPAGILLLGGALGALRLIRRKPA